MKVLRSVRGEVKEKVSNDSIKIITFSDCSNYEIIKSYPLRTPRFTGVKEVLVLKLTVSVNGVGWHISSILQFLLRLGVLKY